MAGRDADVNWSLSTAAGVHTSVLAGCSAPDFVMLVPKRARQAECDVVAPTQLVALLSAVEVEAALRLFVEPKCISKIAVVTILSIHVIATHRMRRNDASSHATCHRRPQQHNQSPILPPF